MCVLAMIWRTHPQWRLVFAGNRDERHARTADALGRWPDAEHVLGGRDRQSGGGWLGVSEEGRLAVVTNVRNPGAPDPAAPSRGLLLKDYLLGQGDYREPETIALDRFNPFTLVCVEPDAAAVLTNHPAPKRIQLDPGVHSLSNGGLWDNWPRAERLKRHLEHWASVPGAAPEELFAALEDQEPSEAESSGHSEIFIRNPVYGTRCSSVIAIDHRGRGLFLERRFEASGDPAGETALTFSWPS